MPDLSAPAWPADRLVFVNDVFFCAGDLMRLLQHEDTDMACGMDFIGWKSPPSTNDIQPYGPYGPPLSVSRLPGFSSDMFLTPSNRRRLSQCKCCRGVQAFQSKSSCCMRGNVHDTLTCFGLAVTAFSIRPS